MNEKQPKLTCAVVRDLLPLYHDRIVSEETRSAVEEHLADCTGCTAELETLRVGLPIGEPTAGTGDRFRRFKKKLKQKRRLINALCFVIGAGVVLSGALYFARTAMIIPYTADAFSEPVRLIYHYDFTDVHLEQDASRPQEDESAPPVYQEEKERNANENANALFVYMCQPFGSWSSEVIRVDGDVNLIYKHPIWNPQQYAMGMHYAVNIISLEEGDRTFSINGKKVYDIGEPDTDLPPYVEAYYEFLHRDGATWSEEHADPDAGHDVPADYFKYYPDYDNEHYLKWDLDGNVIEDTLTEKQ